DRRKKVGAGAAQQEEMTVASAAVSAYLRGRSAVARSSRRAPGRGRRPTSTSGGGFAPFGPVKNDDAIHFDCVCGTRLRAAAKSAGRSVRCPSCQSSVAVPELEPPFEVVGNGEPAESEAPADTESRLLRKKKRSARQRRQALNRVQIGL